MPAFGPLPTFLLASPKTELQLLGIGKRRPLLGPFAASAATREEVQHAVLVDLVADRAHVVAIGNLEHSSGCWSRIALWLEPSPGATSIIASLYGKPRPIDRG